MDRNNKRKQDNGFKTNQEQQTKNLKKEINSIIKSMDFIGENYIHKESPNEKESQIFFNIYQQLGLAWEFLGLQCKHQSGYKKIKEGKEACKICGKIKDVDESHFLIRNKGYKKIGRRSKPNSKKTFETKEKAQIVNDTINFYGAVINVDVHNSYKSKIFGDKISIAAERNITVKENNIECRLDDHTISIELPEKEKTKVNKRYGGFLWEISKKNLKNFPIIFEFNDKYKFLGLTILR